MMTFYGSYFFNVASRGSSIADIMKFDIKTAIFSQDEYFELKEFYKMRMEKENEKVILKLKS